MIYVISERAYWKYINEFGMTHEEVMAHINRSFCIRGEIAELHITKEDNRK